MPLPVAGPSPVTLPDGSVGFTPGASVGYWRGALTYGAESIEFGIVDDSGVAWYWLGIDGWDGAPTSGQVAQRAGDHGGWPSPQFYGPRPLTLRVSASAPDQATRDAARARLQALVPVSDLAALRYDEPIPKTAQVRRSGVLAETCVNLVSVDFAIGLVAPDPRKYATLARIASAYAPNVISLTGITPPLTPPLTLPPQPPAGSVFVDNQGGIATRPTVTVTGLNTSPTLINVTTGQTVTWTNLALGPGDVLSVDFDVKQGYVNGAFRPADAASSWWEIPPGGATVELGGISDGTSLMTITSRDAWN